MVARVGSELAEAILTSVPRAFDAGVEDVLLATLARAVRSWQAERGIVDDAPVSVLVEGHGRTEEILARGDDPRSADLSRTVGWFTTVVPVALDPCADPVHAVKAAKEERLGRPDAGVGFGVLRYLADTELSARPLPSIGFNYLGNVAGGPARSGDLLPVAQEIRLSGSPAGRMVALNSLTINASTVPTADGREISADIAFPAALFDDSDITGLADRWLAELGAVAAVVAGGIPLGLSPSDVPGADVGQADLDDLAARFGDAAIWPLAPLQQGLYFQAELAAAGSAAGAVDVYVTQVIVSLGGDVDAERLRGAARRLFDHHRVLRSGFVRTIGGSVVAVIADDVEIPWEVVDLADDLTSVTDADAAADVEDDRIARIADRERLARFDLDRPPLVRFVLVRHAGGAHLVVTNHHILLDGWSGPLVLADLLALYATGRTYTENTGAAGDFADHLRRLATADTTAGTAAWREVLARVDRPTLVAAGREASVDDLPQERVLTVPAGRTAALEAAARDLGVTLATLVQFAWAVLVSRVSGEQVVTFGETVSGRPADLDGVESMVGLFINTLPVVVDVDPDRSVRDVLARLQSDKVAVLDHQQIGLPDLLAMTGVAGALFDTLMVHESYPVDTDSLTGTGTGTDLEIVDVVTRDATHYPLTLISSLRGETLRMTLAYLPSPSATGRWRSSPTCCCGCSTPSPRRRRRRSATSRCSTWTATSRPWRNRCPAPDPGAVWSTSPGNRRAASPIAWRSPPDGRHSDTANSTGGRLRWPPPDRPVVCGWGIWSASPPGAAPICRWRSSVSCAPGPATCRSI
nr:condensation domain-containing protein [Gordonia sp. NB41Y]